MNYFELFNLPIALQVNQAVVKQKFYELSRKYHPDFYSQASATEQEEVVEMSASINKAFKIFSKADETIKYTLQLKGLLEEDEKYQLSPHFLMEMMELSEQAMEAKLESDTNTKNNILTQISTIENTIYEPVKTIIDNYKEGVTTQEALLQVKEYYYQKKYLNRILDGLA